jgi:hypothetical protein
MHRGAFAEGPPARSQQDERGGHDPLPVLREGNHFNRRLTPVVAGLLRIYLLTQNMARAEPHLIGLGARSREMEPCPEYTTASHFL